MVAGATWKKWECLDSATGEALAAAGRKYHLPDFSNWKNHAAFERAFAPPTRCFGATGRLEKDFRTSLGRWGAIDYATRSTRQPGLKSINLCRWFNSAKRTNAAALLTD